MTTGVEHLRLLVAAPQTVLADLEIPEDKFPRSREGWPDEWR
ncbi:hypothetical protein ACIBK1_02345 [Microbispora rosea]|nr:hypothetical protein [Microbispora rosea]